MESQDSDLEIDAGMSSPLDYQIKSEDSLIGIGGPPSSGKDMLGSYFSFVHGYRRTAFADALKQELYHYNKAPKGALDTPEKQHYRKVMQDYGELKRKEYPYYWIQLTNLYGKVVVTDCRYKNELEEIERLSGKTIYVVNDAAELMRPKHSSETLRAENFDYTFHNEGCPSLHLITRLERLEHLLKLPRVNEYRVMLWYQDLQLNRIYHGR